MKEHTNTVLWAIVACLLWSTAYPGIKIGLEYATPLHFAGVRFIIAGLLILPFTVSLPRYLRHVKENWRMIFLITLFQSVINYTFFYLGMDLVPGAIGAIIVGSQPLFIAVIASMMSRNELLSRKKMAIIAIGISGVVLVSLGRQGLKLGTLAELIGVLLIIVANIASGISNVLVSKAGRTLDPFITSSFSLIAGGLILYLEGWATEGTVMVPMTQGYGIYWISLAWLAIMSATSYSIWYLLLQRPGVSVTDLNLWKFLIPVFGAILSWVLIAGENPQWLTVVGILVISLSLILFYRCNRNSINC